MSGSEDGAGKGCLSGSEGGAGKGCLSGSESGAGKGCLSGSESGAGKGSESGRIELALLVLAFTTVILSDVLDSSAVFFFSHFRISIVNA